MKKLMLLFLVCISLSLSGQRNTISLTFAPTDAGVGFRYDRQLSDYGIYISVSKGNYRLGYEWIDNHTKIGLGTVIYIQSPYNDNIINLFSIGLSYHQYGERNILTIPNKVFYPISLDLGAGIRMEKTNVGFSIDPIKWEGTVNIGYSF